MRITILHFRSAPKDVGAFRADASDSAGTDGVSLEMMKRRALLESIGHEVAICSAYDWADLPVPALEFDRPAVAGMNRNLFGPGIADYASAAELEAAFRESVRELKAQLGQGLSRLAPDMLFVHNVLCLPVHPVATVALTELLDELRLPCVAIHHDILSEGAYKFQPTCPFAQSLLDGYFPPRLANLNHWTINTRNQKALRARGVEARVIHDSMDFRHRLDPRSHEELRSELRSKQGLGAADIVLFVGARISPNKQTELAGHLTAALRDRRRQLEGKRLYHGEVFGSESRIVLVLAGRPERAFADYQVKLFALFDALKLDWIYAGDMVSPVRVAGDGLYALYPDMYAMADIVLYPSGWEGFGNQLLEAFAAELPVVVYEYPVYQEDIGPKGVRVISLGSECDSDDSGLVRIPQARLQEAAAQMIPLLADGAERERVTAHNAEIGRRHFDFTVLGAHLADSVAWAAARRG